MDTGDEVYQRLIAPIEGKMIAIVSRIVGSRDEAEDVFQEVLAVVWQKLSRIDRYPNPHAYILRICINRSYDALRRRVRERRHFSTLFDLAGQECAEAIDHSPELESLAILHEAVRSLPPHQAKAILLRIIDETSYETIGHILGCSEATARSHVSKGKVQLREMLTDRDLF